MALQIKLPTSSTRGRPNHFSKYVLTEVVNYAGKYVLTGKLKPLQNSYASISIGILFPSLKPYVSALFSVSTFGPLQSFSSQRHDLNSRKYVLTESTKTNSHYEISSEQNIAATTTIAQEQGFAFSNSKYVLTGVIPYVGKYVLTNKSESQLSLTIKFSVNLSAVDESSCLNEPQGTSDSIMCTGDATKYAQTKVGKYVLTNILFCASNCLNASAVITADHCQASSNAFFQASRQTIHCLSVNAITTNGWSTPGLNNCTTTCNALHTKGTFINGSALTTPLLRLTLRRSLIIRSVCRMAPPGKHKTKERPHTRPPRNRGFLLGSPKTYFARLGHSGSDGRSAFGECK